MRRINVHVTPRARVAKIISDGDGLRIYTNAPANDGAANASIIKMLSEYFDIPKSQIKIIRGETSRDKIIELP